MVRIVDRKTFLTMPDGTIYAKWGDATGDPSHMYPGEVSMKGLTLGDDFVDQPFFASPQDTHDSGTLFDAWELARAGEPTAPMRIGNDGGRDGLFDQGQHFAVYDKIEVERLLALIQHALASYTTTPPETDA